MIIKDSFIYLIGELVSKLAPFLLLPYLSNKLGVEGYGLLSYYQTYITLLIIITGLSQEGAVARYFYFYGRRSLSFVVSVGYSYTLLCGILFSVFAYILNSEILFYILLVAIFQNLISVQLSLRQCQRMPISYTLIQVLSALVLVITTILMLEFYDNDLVKNRILAILITNVIIFIISYFFYIRNIECKKPLNPRLYKLYFLYIMSFGIPLLCHNLSLFLKGQIDRVFIYHNFTESDLGVYAMGAQLSAILGVVIMAINKALLPYLFDSLKKNLISLKKLQKFALLSFLGLPLLILIIYVFPESFILYMLGNDFIGIKHYVMLFSISVYLSIPYLILVNLLFYFGKNKVISGCSVFTTIIYVLMLIFLANFDVSYIPYASISSAFFVLPMLFFFVKKLDMKNESK